MPVNLGQAFETQPIANATTFTAADTTTAKSIIAAPGQPWRVDAINICSDDTAARVVDFFIRVGATNYLFASVSVPPGSGFGGVAPVELFAAVMPTTEQGFNLVGATSVQAGMETTITAAKTITIILSGGAY